MADFRRGAAAEYAFVEHEHRELARGIDRIHDVAQAVGSLAAPDLSLALLDVVDWCEMVLGPHAAWEDGWLYPLLDRRAGTAWATKLMSFEHHQIGELAGKVEADRELLHREPGRRTEAALRAHLFGLETLLRAHLDREERFLVPLLNDVITATPELAASVRVAAS